MRSGSSRSKMIPSGYSSILRSESRRAIAEARERILLGAAVADLREAVYRQQCLLEALIEWLVEQDQMVGIRAALMARWLEREGI